jgi:hypothetical protein
MTSRRLVALFSSLAMLLLLATAATTTLADHTIPLGASGTDQSGVCQGDYFKIEDADVLEEGTHTYTGTTKDGQSFTAVLTVTLDGSGDVDSITVVSTDPAYLKIVIKAGNEFETEDGPVLSPENGQAISDVAFCLDVEETTTEETTTTAETTTEETTTEETTEETTTTAETTTEETTTEETTEETTTTAETTTEETTSSTTTPEGSVEELTPPSTDTIVEATGSRTVSTGLLLVLAGFLAGALVVIPALARARR